MSTDTTNDTNAALAAVREAADFAASCYEAASRRYDEDDLRVTVCQDHEDEIADLVTATEEYVTQGRYTEAAWAACAAWRHAAQAAEQTPDDE